MGKTFGYQKLVINKIVIHFSLSKILPLLLSFYFISCNGQPCSQLPKSFKSYSQAISLIQKSSFIVKESANTSSSSWISSAKYYSCDGTTGYFILKTDSGREYIHYGIPVNVWDEFKNADSKGSYYDKNIKGRYRLQLNSN